MLQKEAVISIQRLGPTFVVPTGRLLAAGWLDRVDDVEWMAADEVVLDGDAKVRAEQSKTPSLMSFS